MSTNSIISDLALEPVAHLTRDLALAAKTLSAQEARYLVDVYYMMQGNRISANNQVRACVESSEPHAVIAWVATQNTTLENQIKRALDKWTDEQPVGRWAKSITGIGPVITAGLLAHIDIKKAPTVGHIWRLAGLDPKQRWIGRAGAESLFKELRAEHENATLEEIAHHAAQHIGTRPETLIRFATSAKDGEPRKLTATTLTAAMARRPYSVTLKTLVAFKLGECFVKVQGNDNDYYGKLYKKRKLEEQARNDAGKYADQAARSLATKNYGKSTDAYKHLIEGRLPPAQIHARARRWTVKLFLAHLHEVWFRHEFGKEPPMPYPIAHLGHAHVIPPPPDAKVN